MDQGVSQTGERSEAAHEVPRPLSDLAAVGRVFSTSALSPVRRKRGMILLILSLLPVILILIASLFETDRGHGSFFFTMVVVTTYHYIELIVFIFLGCAVLGEDIESRTLTYDLVCPVSRISLFAGRYLTYVVSSLLLVLPSLTALYIVCMVPYGADAVAHFLPRLWAVLIAAAAGALVYGSAFMLMSMVTRRAVLAAVILTVCVEGFVANLPLRLSTYSILFHLRNIMAAVSGAPEFFPLPRMQMIEAVQVDTGDSVMVLLLLWAVFTIGSGMIFVRKQFP